jgi:RimJ/RimL family protein N-acetyltransferase
MSIPIVETARLILRGPKPDDFAAYAAMWADPETTRHIGDGSPKSIEDSWTSFLRHAGHWHIVGFGSWIVEEKASRRAIGVLGFNERKRERAPDLDGLPELGWMFDRSASGKGYATEALKGAARLGQRNAWARARDRHYRARQRRLDPRRREMRVYTVQTRRIARPAPTLLYADALTRFVKVSCAAFFEKFTFRNYD